MRSEKGLVDVARIFGDDSYKGSFLLVGYFCFGGMSLSLGDDTTGGIVGEIYIYINIYRITASILRVVYTVLGKKGFFNRRTESLHRRNPGVSFQTTCSCRLMDTNE